MFRSYKKPFHYSPIKIFVNNKFILFLKYYQLIDKIIYYTYMSSLYFFKKQKPNTHTKTSIVFIGETQTMLNQNTQLSSFDTELNINLSTNIPGSDTTPITPTINNDPIRQPAPSAPTKIPKRVGLILRIVSAITGTMLVVGNAQILQTIVTNKTVLNIWFLIRDLKGLDTLFFSTKFGILFFVILKISRVIINEIR